MMQRKPAQDLLTRGCEAHAHLPAVPLRALAPHHIPRFQPVQQPYDTVLPQQKPFGQCAYGRRAVL